MPILLLALIVWGDWGQVIIHDDTRVSQWSEHICFLSHSSFQWDKQPRLIWKLLSFPSEPLKAMLYFQPTDFFVFCKGGFIPSRLKTFNVCHSQKWKVVAEVNDWLTALNWSIMSSCSVLMHLYLHSLTNKLEASITLHLSALGLTLCYPTQVHRCLATLLHRGPLGSPSVLRQQAHMSLSAGCSQGIQAGTPSPSTLPWRPRGHPQGSRAGWGGANCGVEWRWTVSRGKRLMKKQKLCPD